MRKTTIATVFVVIVTLLVTGNVHPAAAVARTENDTLYCDHITFTGNIGAPIGGQGVHFFIYVRVLGVNITVPVSSGGIFTTSDGSFSGSVYFNVPVGTTLHYGVFDTQVGTVSACSSSSSSSAVTYFNPGDGRVDPRPGDRIAVYCNQGTVPSIGVYGIDQQGHGIHLVEVLVSTIANSKDGVTVSAGSNGSVSIVKSGDTFWVRWDGPFNSASSAPFDKIVTCTF